MGSVDVSASYAMCFIKEVHVAFKSHLKTKEHHCLQFLHCLSCNIFCQRLREKKESFSQLLKEGDQSLLSHHTCIFAVFFFFNWTVLQICSNTGFQTCEALKGKMAQHMHEGSWTLLDRSTAAAKAKDGKAQHPENLARSRKKIPHLLESSLSSKVQPRQTAVPLWFI